MTNTVFLKLADLVSLFSAVDVSLDDVLTPLRQLAASPVTKMWPPAIITIHLLHGNLLTNVPQHQSYTKYVTLCLQLLWQI